MWVTIAIGAVVGGLIGGGLEIYDQYKNGTLEWSWKYVGKIAVSTLQGAVEGAVILENEMRLPIYDIEEKRKM